MSDKVFPSDREAEVSVLGQMVSFPNCLLIGCDMLNEESFYEIDHRLIFKSLRLINNANKNCDLISLSDSIKKQGDIEVVGGLKYLMTLTNEVVSDVNFEEHCLILKEKEISRKQILLCNEVLQKAYGEHNDALETNRYLSDKVYEINSIQNISYERNNVEILNDVVESINKATEFDGMIGIDTGYSDVNKITGGFRPTELLILAARPGMGKTALAICLALNAVMTKKKCLFFSLEMGDTEIMKRFLSVDSYVKSDVLRNGSPSEQDWSSIHQSISRLEGDYLKLVDDVYDISGIINKCKIERLRSKVDFIVIDYLQLIENKKRGASREQEVSDISRRLKLLAKELKVPVLALSQLSRSVETRGGDKRPMLSDLRESGAIEQDADVVMFLYRAQYYGFSEDENGESTDGKAELIFAKNRSGSLANIPLLFNHSCTRFDNINYYPKNITPNNEF